jgi:hypothetical protein
MNEEIFDKIFENSHDDARLALSILLEYGQTDGAHHKAWVIDQAVRALAGPYYDELISAYKDGEDGPETYGWDKGIAP